jgi:flagellar hook protein FlgE
MCRFILLEHHVMALGLFQTSVLGMSSQSHALGVISNNIANVSTGGFKRSDTAFSTLLSDTIAFQPGNPATPWPSSTQSDLGGVRAYDVARISEAGEYITTGRDMDIAIQGRGFFVMNGAVNGSGNTVYGRDGQLFEASVGTLTIAGTDGAPITVQQGYLVDKNGYFLQGWAAAADGSIGTAGPLTSIRVDPDAFAASGEATTAAKLALNLPASSAAGSVETYGIDVFDSAWQQQSLQLSFSKSAASPLLWSMSVNGTPAGDLQFGSDGKITSPSSLQLSLPLANGAGAGDDTRAEFTLDVSGFTQYANDLIAYDYTRDGYAPGALESIRFNAEGDVVGVFDNGRSRTLYRLAIANFANPDGLGGLSGNVYEETASSGAAVLSGAGEAGRGLIAADTLEKSNVDLGDEFSQMVLTQNAYNSSATAFRTLDEMTQVARDLYR